MTSAPRLFDACACIQDDKDLPVSSPYDPAALNPKAASEAIRYENIQQQLAALHLHRYTPTTLAHRSDPVPSSSDWHASNLVWSRGA